MPVRPLTWSAECGCGSAVTCYDATERDHWVDTHWKAYPGHRIEKRNAQEPAPAVGRLEISFDVGGPTANSLYNAAVDVLAKFMDDPALSGYRWPPEISIDAEPVNVAQTMWIGHVRAKANPK